MRRKHKVILAAVVLIDLVVIFAFKQHAAHEVAVVPAAAPTNGMVGGTTSTAAERAQQQDPSQPAAAPHAPVAGGIAPPAPADQLAPLTKGAGDMVDDVPAGAEVTGDAGKNVPTLINPAPASAPVLNLPAQQSGAPEAIAPMPPTPGAAVPPAVEPATPGAAPASPAQAPPAAAR